MGEVEVVSDDGRMIAGSAGDGSSRSLLFRIHVGASRRI